MKDLHGGKLTKNCIIKTNKKGESFRPIANFRTKSKESSNEWGVTGNGLPKVVAALTADPICFFCTFLPRI
jgi:hypothetical protein